MNEEKKQQVIALGRLGWSLRRIQRNTGIRRETVAAYLKSAGIAATARRLGTAAVTKPANEVITDSAPAKPANDVITDPAPAKPANEVITDSGAELPPKPRRRNRSPAAVHQRAPACPTGKRSTGLSRGRNAMAIWQDLVDTYGFAAGYQSVRRFVSKLQPSQSPEACAVIETAPGEEAQVDYGAGPMVRDPQSGKYRRTRLFVLTLGYSRKSVRLLVFRSSSQIWAELHEKAFRRLGGVTRIIVLDNLREGVLTPDIYDPTINLCIVTYCGITGSFLCLAGSPSGSQGEGGAGSRSCAEHAAERAAFRKSVEEAQTYLDHWEERWADTRIHGTTKRQVAAMFAEERPVLLPLPVEPFRYYQYGESTVHLDGCVEVEAAYYGAPPGWIGRRVPVQWDLRAGAIDDPDGPVAARTLAPGARRPSHPRARPLPAYAAGHAAPAGRADRAGSQIGALCRRMHGAQGETTVRRILGVLSLAKKHGAASVEEACTAALEVGVCDYRFVRRYLERHPRCR